MFTYTIMCIYIYNNDKCILKAQNVHVCQEVWGHKIKVKKIEKPSMIVP